MQFSEHWLRTMCNPQLDSETLGHRLTMAGLEVEECNPVAPPFSGVVVAEIVATEKHPDADKLKVCSVDAGGGELLQIVCGAPNAAVGMKVPLAKVGASLPGFEIKRAKLRGVESFGMLCSARELGISEDHGGLLALPDDAPVAAEVRSYLGLDDNSFVIKLTPNRADCLSITGVARELAALTGVALKLPLVEPVAAVIEDTRAIVLDAPEACPRYCGRIVRGVNARAETPHWMKQRLERSGVRSISALVDITNYVMLELGQPLHVFDDARLVGAVHVRYPATGESVLLLNEQTVKPDPNTLLIADESRALALAGIMGGEESGVTLDTTDVFIESAFFSPDAIAGKARQYGFSSDASHRFERGVDFELARTAIERATALTLDICGGQAGPVVEALSELHLPRREAVSLRPARLRRVLGVALDDDTIVGLLGGIGLTAEREGDSLVVVPPTYRFDIAIEEDLIEEVVRLYGYDNVPAVAPKGRLEMLQAAEATRPVWRVRHLLADRDYQEVINYAFVDAAWERDFCGNEQPIRLANPIASQMSVMRTGLISGLVSTLSANRKRQLNRVRVFELGRCFEVKADGVPVDGYQQPLRLAALAWGGAVSEQWAVSDRKVDFYDVKADLEALLEPALLEFEVFSHPALHPGRSASVRLNGRFVGVIGELHPLWVEAYELGSAPVVFEVELDAVCQREIPVYREVSRLPFVARDLALIVDGCVTAEKVRQTLQAAAPGTVKSVELFDVYVGKGVDPGKRSLAFRVLMQDTQKTLEESDVEEAISAMLHQAEAALGARLRG